jgi:hypothetical protein
MSRASAGRRGAVADQVRSRGRVEQGERLDEHVGCLVVAEPAGEGYPRPGKSRIRPGGHALHRRAPVAQPAAQAQPRRPRADRGPVGEQQVNPACRLPGLRRVVAAGPGHLVVLAGHQRHERRHRPRRRPPGPDHVRVDHIGGRQPRAKPAGERGLRRPLQAARARQLAHPERLGRKPAAGRQRHPRRRRIPGQQRGRHATPAQRRRQPQRRQLAPAGLQHAQHPDHPQPTAHPGTLTSFPHPAHAARAAVGRQDNATGPPPTVAAGHKPTRPAPRASRPEPHCGRQPRPGPGRLPPSGAGHKPGPTEY